MSSFTDILKVQLSRCHLVFLSLSLNLTFLVAYFKQFTAEHNVVQCNAVGLQEIMLIVCENTVRVVNLLFSRI